jgi:hypothetical protein
MKFDPRSGTGKPGIAIMIGVKPSKKDDKKKYGAAAGAQPHDVMKESPHPRLNTKDMQAADRRTLAPKSLNRGGHLSGPPMNPLDWQLTEGYGGADKRNRDYDMEMAERGDPDFDWPRRHQIYRDEDEQEVYGDTSPGSRNFTEEELRDNNVSNLAYQQDQERQQIMNEGIDNPREKLDVSGEPVYDRFENEKFGTYGGRASSIGMGRKVRTGEPMDIAFQLLKDSAKARDGSPFAFPKRDDPNVQPLPPNIDPSWTPEAIARINAQNDEARRALRGGQ